jgi:hypothetical protein
MARGASRHAAGTQAGDLPEGSTLKIKGIIQRFLGEWVDDEIPTPRPRPAPHPSSPFDTIRRYDEEANEFWTARDLMPFLGYARYENLENAIRKAQSACRNSGQDPTDHFRDVTNMIPVGNGALREAADVRLTRFACYLVAMNGDPDKPEVAAAQQYFARMTRVAEMAADGVDVVDGVPITPHVRGIARRKRRNSRWAKRRQVVSNGCKGVAAGIKDIGGGTYHQALRHDGTYKGLCGLETQELRDAVGAPGREPPLNYMEPIMLAAHALASECFAKPLRDGKVPKREIGNAARHAAELVRNGMLSAIPGDNEVVIAENNRGVRTIDVRPRQICAS